MAYREEDAQRLRDALIGLPEISELRMMGALCFTTSGNMLGGAFVDREAGPSFMFRVGKDNMSEALERPAASQMKNGGRVMGGFVRVEADIDACDDEDLTGWITLTMSFVGAPPPKP